MGDKLPVSKHWRFTFVELVMQVSDAPPQPNLFLSTNDETSFQIVHQN